MILQNFKQKQLDFSKNIRDQNFLEQLQEQSGIDEISDSEHSLQNQIQNYQQQIDQLPEPSKKSGKSKDHSRKMTQRNPSKNQKIIDYLQNQIKNHLREFEQQQQIITNKDNQLKQMMNQIQKLEYQLKQIKNQKEVREQQLQNEIENWRSRYQLKKQGEEEQKYPNRKVDSKENLWQVKDENLQLQHKIKLLELENFKLIKDNQESNEFCNSLQETINWNLERQPQGESHNILNKRLSDEQDNKQKRSQNNKQKVDMNTNRSASPIKKHTTIDSDKLQDLKQDLETERLKNQVLSEQINNLNKKISSMLENKYHSSNQNSLQQIQKNPKELEVKLFKLEHLEDKDINKDILKENIIQLEEILHQKENDITKLKTELVEYQGKIAKLECKLKKLNFSIEDNDQNNDQMLLKKRCQEMEIQIQNMRNQSILQAQDYENQIKSKKQEQEMAAQRFKDQLKENQNDLEYHKELFIDIQKKIMGNYPNQIELEKNEPQLRLFQESKISELKINNKQLENQILQLRQDDEIKQKKIDELNHQIICLRLDLDENIEGDQQQMSELENLNQGKGKKNKEQRKKQQMGLKSSNNKIDKPSDQSLQAVSSWNLQQKNKKKDQPNTSCQNFSYINLSDGGLVPQQESSLNDLTQEQAQNKLQQYYDKVQKLSLQIKNQDQQLQQNKQIMNSKDNYIDQLEDDNRQKDKIMNDLKNQEQSYQKQQDIIDDYSNNLQKVQQQLQQFHLINQQQENQINKLQNQLQMSNQEQLIREKEIYILRNDSDNSQPSNKIILKRKLKDMVLLAFELERQKKDNQKFKDQIIQLDIDWNLKLKQKECQWQDLNQYNQINQTKQLQMMQQHAEVRRKSDLNFELGELSRKLSAQIEELQFENEKLKQENNNLMKNQKQLDKFDPSGVNQTLQVSLYEAEIKNLQGELNIAQEKLSRAAGVQTFQANLLEQLKKDNDEMQVQLSSGVVLNDVNQKQKESQIEKQFQNQIKELSKESQFWRERGKCQDELILKKDLEIQEVKNKNKELYEKIKNYEGNQQQLLEELGRLNEKCEQQKLYSEEQAQKDIQNMESEQIQKDFYKEIEQKNEQIESLLDQLNGLKSQQFQQISNDNIAYDNEDEDIKSNLIKKIKAQNFDINLKDEIINQIIGSKNNKPMPQINQIQRDDIKNIYYSLYKKNLKQKVLLAIEFQRIKKNVRFDKNDPRQKGEKMPQNLQAYIKYLLLIIEIKRLKHLLQDNSQKQFKLPERNNQHIVQRESGVQTENQNLRDKQIIENDKRRIQKQLNQDQIDLIDQIKLNQTDIEKDQRDFQLEQLLNQNQYLQKKLDIFEKNQTYINEEGNYNEQFDPTQIYELKQENQFLFDENLQLKKINSDLIQQISTFDRPNDMENCQLKLQGKQSSIQQTKSPIDTKNMRKSLNKVGGISPTTSSKLKNQGFFSSKKSINQQTSPLGFLNLKRSDSGAKSLSQQNSPVKKKSLQFRQQLIQPGGLLIQHSKSCVPNGPNQQVQDGQKAGQRQKSQITLNFNDDQNDFEVEKINHKDPAQGEEYNSHQKIEDSVQNISKDYQKGEDILQQGFLIISDKKNAKGEEFKETNQQKIQNLYLIIEEKDLQLKRALKTKVLLLIEIDRLYRVFNKKSSNGLDENLDQNQKDQFNNLIKKTLQEIEGDHYIGDLQDVGNENLKNQLEQLLKEKEDFVKEISNLQYQNQTLQKQFKFYKEQLEQHSKGGIGVNFPKKEEFLSENEFQRTEGNYSMQLCEENNNTMDRHGNNKNYSQYQSQPKNQFGFSQNYLQNQQEPLVYTRDQNGNQRFNNYQTSSSNQFRQMKPEVWERSKQHEFPSNRVNELQFQVQILKQNEQKLEELNKKQGQDIQEAQLKCFETQQKNEELEYKIKYLEEDIKNLRTRTKETKHQILPQDFESSLQENQRESDFNNILHENHRLSKNLADRNLIIASLQDQRRISQEENEQLRVLVDKKQREIQQLTNFQFPNEQKNTFDAPGSVHLLTDQLQIAEDDKRKLEFQNYQLGSYIQQLENKLNEISQHTPDMQINGDHAISKFVHILKDFEEKSELERENYKDLFNKLKFQIEISKVPEINREQLPSSNFDWQEKLSRLQKQRENDLNDLKEFLSILNHSLIQNSGEIEFQAERVAYESIVSQLKSQVSQLEIHLNEKNQKIQKLETEMNYYKENNQIEPKAIQLEQENKNLKNQIRDQQDLIIKIQSEKSIIATSLKQVEVLNQTLQEEINSAYALLTKRKQERDELVRRIEELRLQKDLVKRSSIEDINENQSRLQNLMEENRFLRMENKSFKVENEWKQRELTDNIAKLVLKIEELDVIKAKYQQALNKIHHLQTQALEKINQEEIQFSLDQQQ